MKFGRNDKVASFKNLYFLVGILGFLLPFLCLLGLLITNTALQPSISHCYYTNVRDVFIGIMIGVSMFLITYSGYQMIDDIVTNTAGVVGIGLALCPCLNYQGATDLVGYFNLNPIPSNAIHLLCASVFFLLLAINSYYLFTKTKDKNHMTKEKINRNKIYKICGLVMFGLMFILVILKLIMKDKFDDYPIAFTIESFMLFAFSFSWLVKGGMILKDKIKEK
jgi:TRAP-type C4-dicarboxylate transport system permease small subunit